MTLKNNLTATALVFILIFNACAPIKPIVFESYENVKLKTDGSKATCSIDVRIKNPNKVGCTLKDFKSKVIVNSVYIGDVSLRNKVRVAPGKVVTLPIVVEAPISSVVPLVKTSVEMVLHQDKKVPVVMGASITLKKSLIKKSFKFKFQQDYSLKEMRG